MMLDDLAEKDAPARTGLLMSALSPTMNLRRLRLIFWPRRSGGSGGSNNSAGDAGDAEPRKLRPTAYLDGLRGFAAFLVYIHHHELWAHGGSWIFENAFGYKGEFHLCTFPGFRNLFTGGHMAVAVFYVISGYVLSAKALSLVHAGEHARAQLGDYLASAFFRRWFRLYLPLMATTFGIITSWHLFGVANPHSPPKATYGEEVWNWYAEFKNFSFLYSGSIVWPSYNPHLWSIPLEMRGSLFVFTAILALSRATTRARLWCQVALIVYFMYIADGYYGALFIAGMLQCDLDMLAREQPDGGHNPEFPGFLRRLERYKKFIYYHLLFIAVYLAGVPSQTADVKLLSENPGWYWLSFLKPQALLDYKWFYLFIAANILVAAIPRMPWLKAFFETRFCQFLGRISFSLYLVHGPILNTVGDRVYHAVGWRFFGEAPDHLANWVDLLPLSGAGPLGLEVRMIVPQIVLLPLTFYIAHVVTRTIDEPSVRLASRLYKAVLTYGKPPPPTNDIVMRMA